MIVYPSIQSLIWRLWFAVLVWLFSPAAYSQYCENVVNSQNHSVTASEIEHEFDSGARWKMCWHIDANSGLTLSNVAYGAPAEPVRKILQTAALAQILFKYDADTTASHVLSENGLGSAAHRQADEHSCPTGEIHTGENSTGICIKLRDKNMLTNLRRRESRRRHELQVHASSSIGAHHFEQVWRFSEDGQINPAVRMSGELERFTRQKEFGSIINAQLPLAANASLLFTWRMDLNIADTPNNDLVEQVEFRPFETNVVRRILETRALDVESLHNVDRARFRGWLMKDANISAAPAGTTRVGYYLDPQSSGFDYVSRTLNWANFDFAVTRKRPCEQLASGNGMANDNCGDTLDDFVNGESVQGEDVVVWFSLARQFIPGSEDFPAISTREAGFNLMPFDWSASTPFTALEP